MVEDEREELLAQNYLTLVELAYLSGTSQRLVLRLISLELIRPVQSEPEPLFRPQHMERVRKLLHLHSQLGVSWSSMGLVMDLLERIDELEKRLGKER